MALYSFVYFDLDDTLLDHRRAEKLALGELVDAFPEIFADNGLDTILDTYHAVNTDVWHRYSDGELSKDRAKLERFELLCQQLDISKPVAASELSAYYMGKYATHWAFLPGGRDAFTEISDRFDVGILTNGFKDVQNAKLDQFPVLRTRSHSVIISEEVGFMKPDRRIFEFAAEKAGCVAEEILYIGDSFRSDVQGGQSAGWNVAWLYPEEDDRLPGRRFESWRQILAWLDLGL